MGLRLARYRMKTEWPKLLALVFCILFLCWFENFYVDSLRTLRDYNLFYQYYGDEEYYLSSGRAKLAMGWGLAEEELGETPQEGFRALRRLRRGFVCIKLIMGSDQVIILLTNALAVLFLTGLLANRRLEPLLASGCSRRKLFLSLSLTYFGGAALLWLGSVCLMLPAFGVTFLPEERSFFFVMLLSWFLSTMTAAACSYLFAFLLRRPFPAFAAALGAYLLVAALIPDRSGVPVQIMGSSLLHKSLDPGEDLGWLITGDWIALAFILLSVIAAWLAFRRRDQI